MKNLKKRKMKVFSLVEGQSPLQSLQQSGLLPGAVNNINTDALIIDGPYRDHVGVIIESLKKDFPCTKPAICLMQEMKDNRDKLLSLLKKQNHESSDFNLYQDAIAFLIKNIKSS